MLLTQRQARQFLLRKHGLLGAHRFVGKAGALAFIRQAGCIQYDPVDVCGRNADLTLQSRVKGYGKAMLDALLYTDRALVDYTDKNLSIIPVEDWPYFERYRQASRQNAEKYPDIQALAETAHTYIATNGPVCSDDLKMDGETRWWSAIHWSAGSNPSRAVLEQLYATGELVVHHKKGTRKFYDLIERHIPADILQSPEPLPDERAHQAWRVLRRIGAVGLLWNKPSDAWLHIWGMKADERNEIFRRLLDEEKIIEITVEGLKAKLYGRADDGPLLETVLQDSTLTPRCELIAPLDVFLWDRKLIKALFGFEYAWEIYSPPQKRKYGYYVLPLLYGESFAGRVEAAADRKTKTLVIKNIWYEDGAAVNSKKFANALDRCFKRFAAFNDCERVERK